MRHKKTNLAAHAFSRARMADPFAAAPWTASAAAFLEDAAAVAASAVEGGPSSDAEQLRAEQQFLRRALADGMYAATTCSNPVSLEKEGGRGEQTRAWARKGRCKRGKVEIGNLRRRREPWRQVVPSFVPSLPSVLSAASPVSLTDIMGCYVAVHCSQCPPKL